MLPHVGIDTRSWKKVPRIKFPVSNFLFAMHDLIYTLRDKGKLSKRCQRLFILFNIICAMNRQIDLEKEFHFKTILSRSWTEKEIVECQEALKGIKDVIHNESDIAMRTLLATPQLSSRTCAAIFPQLKMPDCVIKGRAYPSDELIRYIYEYVDGVIELESLAMIPTQNLCIIMQTINKEISDYAIQKKVAIDVFTKLRQYNLQNLSLGDWQIISTQYIMFPYVKRLYAKRIDKFALDMYNKVFVNVFKQINTLLPNNHSYQGPVINRGCMAFKTAGRDTKVFETFIERNNIEYDGFYKYGIELDLWDFKNSSIVNKLIDVLETTASSNIDVINNDSKNVMKMINPSSDEANIRKNWQFLTPGIFEKPYTITKIGNGVVVSKSVGNKVRTTVVVSVYVRQRYWSKGRVQIIPHMIPIFRINIMRRSAGYTIPPVLLNRAYLGLSLMYYQSYLETIKISVRNNLDNFSPNTNPLIISESIYTLTRFYCGYYSFLQNYNSLARNLSIVSNEKTVVDVCRYASDPNNFNDPDKASDFYEILDEALSSDEKTRGSLDIGKTPSIFKIPRSDEKVREVSVTIPKHRRRKRVSGKPPPEPTIEEQEQRWILRQKMREQTLKQAAKGKRIKGQQRYMYEKCEHGYQCKSGCCVYNKKYKEHMYDVQLATFRKSIPGGRLTKEQLLEFNVAFEKEHDYMQCSPPEFCGEE